MTEDQAYRNLANAVIERAAADWRQLCKEKDVTDSSFTALRRFFRGEWAQALCGKVSAKYILTRLETERQLSLKNRRS